MQRCDQAFHEAFAAIGNRANIQLGIRINPADSLGHRRSCLNCGERVLEFIGGDEVTARHGRGVARFPRESRGDSYHLIIFLPAYPLF